MSFRALNVVDDHFLWVESVGSHLSVLLLLLIFCVTSTFNRLALRMCRRTVSLGLNEKK